MSLYPSLEDMKVDKMAKAQVAASQPPPQRAIAQGPGVAVSVAHTATPAGGSLYPSLTGEYMGLELTRYVPPGAVVPASQSQAMVAPVSGAGNVGVKRAEIKQGIRELVLCKDKKGTIGMCVMSISKGVFVAMVQKDSPAAMAGLRFGDQILSVNDELVAGYSKDKATKVLKNSPKDRISVAVRDRPFERTITMQKDSQNHVGFLFRGNEIYQIVKDSSAARNGILTEHCITEMNGQNMIGLKDKEIAEVFAQSPRTVTITIMPKFVYDHMVSRLGSGLRKMMDHSIPDV